MPAVRALRHHDQEIDVALGISFTSRPTTRRGTEENDAKRSHEPDDIFGKPFYSGNVYGGNAGLHVFSSGVPNPENPKPKSSDKISSFDEIWIF